MISNNYKDLIVWQKAMDLVVEIYNLVVKLPNDEKYELSSQMRRAAVSIPSNIAEGQGRRSFAEFDYFLGVARGSACELETQLFLSERIKLLSENDIKYSLELLEEIQKMISSLMKNIKTKNSELRTNN